MSRVPMTMISVTLLSAIMPLIGPSLS